MKRWQTLCVGLVAGGLTLAGSVAHAVSLTYTFSDKDFLGGASWGTMVVEAAAANAVQVTYTAAGASAIPSGSTATRFGFGFDRSLVSGIANYTDPYLALNWLVDTSNNLTFPQPANGDEFSPPVTANMFYFGAVDDVNGMSGVGVGQADRFDIIFASDYGFQTMSEAMLHNFLDPVGVRLQGLPNDINTGSLFLAGKLTGGDNEYPVPEPGSLLLLGTGLLGLGSVMRRRRS